MSSGATPDKRRLLLRSSLLADLPEGDLDRLATYMRIARYPASAVIFRKGDPGHGMMIVLEGRVKITSMSPAGKEIVLNIINPGEVFGEIALLDGEERTADAVAAEDTELLVLDRREFIPFLERHPRVCVDLLAILCRRIRRTTALVEDSLFLDLPSRLGKTLLRLAEDHGRETPDGIRIDLKLSQRELGNLVGMTRESVNKQLRAWRERGLVDQRGGFIVIPDLDALEDEAAFHD